MALNFKYVRMRKIQRAIRDRVNTDLFVQAAFEATDLTAFIVLPETGVTRMLRGGEPSTKG